MCIKQIINKMKKGVSKDKNKENNPLLMPMSFNKKGGFDNESLEVEL